jgi:uncharacterized protein
MRLCVVIIAAGLALLLPAETRAQAVDCAAARTPAERAICGDARLRALDREYAALHAADDPARRALRQFEHAAWVQFRELCADNTRCLVQWYETRLADLRPRQPAGAGEPPAPRAQPRPAPGDRLRVVEAPDLRVLGREALRGGALDRIGAIGGLALLGSEPVDDLAPPAAPPGDGRLSVMPDGTIQKRLEGGFIAYYNPVTDEMGQILPDGSRVRYNFLQVQPDAPPALPPDYGSWSASVAASVSGLVTNLLTPAEAETLRSSAPADFFDNLDYHLRILAFITG